MFIDWLQPFVTAIPLYVLMPEIIVPEGALSFLATVTSSRYFVFPAAWFIVNVLMFLSSNGSTGK